MNYLSIEKVSKSYGDKILFKDISFGIDKGQKVGLVARNGSGKSTLLNIILGKVLPDSGNVAIRKDIRIGYLEQNPDFSSFDNIEDFLYDENFIASKFLKQYQESLILGADDKEFQKLIELMETHDVWSYEQKRKEILGKFSLDLEMKVKNLSGGQKKKAALAKVLVNAPDLLILDEPTNHLDIEMIEWLESFLQYQNITLLLVTHDRYFLENVCNTIVELFQGKIYQYVGNYQYFLEQKAIRQDNFLKEIEKAQNSFRKELEWIRKQPKARTTKSKARIDAFEEIYLKAHQKIDNQKVDIQINMQRTGSKILELHNIGKSYNDKFLFKNFHYKFIKEDKVGLLGKNGSGKSTLLKIIMNQVEPDQGKVVWGETITPAYYSQDGLQLPEDKRVIEVIRDIAEYIPLKKGRKLTASQLLEKFLFTYDQHYTFVSNLSGGEKRRLYFLTLLMKNPNFLILDEPTNDLDIDTLNALEDFLEDYPGCILLVSHDRYFIDRIVNHVFVIQEDSVEIKDFPGTYTEYLAWKTIEEEKKSKIKYEAKIAEQKSASSQVKAKKLSYNEQRELEKLELEIPEMEAEKTNLEKQMENPQENILELSKKYQKLIEDLEKKTDRWLELSDR